MPNMMSDRRVAPRYALILPAEVVELSHGVRRNARPLFAAAESSM